jgi:hypothetical protein
MAANPHEARQAGAHSAGCVPRHERSEERDRARPLISNQRGSHSSLGQDQDSSVHLAGCFPPDRRLLPPFTMSASRRCGG